MPQPLPWVSSPDLFQILADPIVVAHDHKAHQIAFEHKQRARVESRADFPIGFSELLQPKSRRPLARLKIVNQGADGLFDFPLVL